MKILKRRLLNASEMQQRVIVLVFMSRFLHQIRASTSANHQHHHFNRPSVIPIIPHGGGVGAPGELVSPHSREVAYSQRVMSRAKMVSQPLPLNYYAYNHQNNNNIDNNNNIVAPRTGYYKPPTMPPMTSATTTRRPVTAVRESHRTVEGVSRHPLLQQSTTISPPSMTATTMPSSSASESSSTTFEQLIAVSPGPIQANDPPLTRQTDIAQDIGSNHNVDVTEENGRNETSIERMVDGVRRYYSGFVRSVIRAYEDEDAGEMETMETMVNESDEEENDDDADQDDDITTSKKVSTIKSTSSPEASSIAPSQGHRLVTTSARAIDASSPPASASLSSYGTGRKLKRFRRKLRRFMLPLLLAYKLKFLTLIPVLIGGLTLLVGTTGLAGFFFALFTATIGLKMSGGGSKSVVIKKF